MAGVVARVAAPSHASRFHASRVCGIERWSIKTLQDRPRLLPARKTTIAHLVSIHRPAHVPTKTRLAAERRI